MARWTVTRRRGRVPSDRRAIGPVPWGADRHTTAGMEATPKTARSTTAHRRAAHPDDRRSRLAELKRDLSRKLSTVERAERTVDAARTKRASVIAAQDAHVAEAEAGLARALQALASGVGGQRAAQELTGLPASAFRAPATSTS